MVYQTAKDKQLLDLFEGEIGNNIRDFYLEANKERFSEFMTEFSEYISYIEPLNLSINDKYIYIRSFLIIYAQQIHRTVPNISGMAMINKLASDIAEEI